MRLTRAKIPKLGKRTPRDISTRRAVALTCAITGFFFAVRFLPSVESFETKFSRAVEYNVRHSLKRDPKLDPKIAIYGFGDSSLSDLKAEDLSLDDWAAVLKAMARVKPRVVIIDKVFSAPRPPKEAANFVATLKALPYPVVAASFVSGAPIPGRTLLPVPNVGNFIPDKSASHEAIDALDWLSVDGGYPYGPSATIAEAFTHVGHAVYFGNLNLRPVLRLSRQDILPTLALYAAQKFQFVGGKLFADDRLVPMDAKGRVAVNLAYPAAYYDRTFKISSLVKKAASGELFSIAPDSVVILLPSMFTGSTDMQNTPFGFLPGGYFITAAVNSVLTGQWIATPWFGSILILICGLFGFVLLRYVSAKYFWVALAVGLLATACLGLGSFAYGSVELPWFFAILTGLTTAITLFVENGRIAQKRFTTVGVAEKDFSLVMDQLRAEPVDGKPAEGVHLGRYHVLEVIGSGGMGEVYRAKTYGAGGFEKEFAVKRIIASSWGKEEMLRLFEEEARLNSVLNHANITQVIEFFRMNETYLMVMEFVPGKNLAELIRQARACNVVVPLTMAVQIVREVCQGLEYAHNKTDPKTGTPLKIIHRDISPQNVMLSYEGAVKLIDFGIAKGKFHDDRTAAGIIKGKFCFMSPEQARGVGVDHRTDLFSAGLILYELVTGARILEGNTDIETIENVRLCRIPPVLVLNPSLPDSLDHVLRRALAKNPENRYSSATEMIADLQALLQEYPGPPLTKSLTDIMKNLFLDRPANLQPIDEDAAIDTDAPTQQLTRGIK